MKQNSSAKNYKYIFVISANGILNYSFFEDFAPAQQRMEQEYESFCEIQGVEPQDEHWMDERSCYARIDNQFGTAAQLTGEIVEIP